MDNNKAVLNVKIDEITVVDGKATGSYSQTNASNSGSGKTPPSVDGQGNVTVYEDTNVTFELEVEGYTFPADGAAVIRLQDDAGNWQDLVPGDSFLTFTIGSNQPTNNNTELELEDDDSDGTSEGVTHPYNLYVTSAGTTYTLDPNFVNKN